MTMPREIDVDTPSPARVYDYLLGGKTNFAVDRQAAEAFLERWPDVAENARVNRAWLIRVVQLLAARGVTQFLDIGSGLPTADNVHQVAQRIAPDARVLYVDHDPVVLAHGRAMLAEDPRTDYVDADARDAGEVLARAERHLDPARPTVVLMASVLHYLPEPPAQTARSYADWLEPGGHLAISHVCADGGADEAMLASLAEHLPDLTPRPRAEIAAAFDGLALLEPGLVEARQWRPEQDVPLGPLPLLAGVGEVA